ncbi:MAG: 50S ribosomal protein L25 [Candidatus Yanofskybacteria bacterium]|nr:50S ribosomal protein L25 [Candidatus Yanofskybacteria bacterium]
MAHAQHKIELRAEERTILGSGVKALRKSGYVPVVLYGKGQKSIPLQVPVKDFNKVLKEAGESTLVYVGVGSHSYPTIIHDVSLDPVNDSILHADFYKVSLTEKIKTEVPVVFIGESPAVKDLSGILIKNVNELEVEALPQNLPHEINIDISSLKNFGDQILVKDIKLGPDVKLVTDEELILATVQEPKSQEELEAELAEPSKGVEDVEVIEKKKEEVPAEGEEEAEVKAE